MNNMKNNKYIYGYEIQGNYGQGWECECYEETFKEARQRIKEYRENSPYPVRMVDKRIKNPNYIETITSSNTSK
jgi:hypothetical protein